MNGSKPRLQPKDPHEEMMGSRCVCGDTNPTWTGALVHNDILLHSSRVLNIDDGLTVREPQRRREGHFPIGAFYKLPPKDSALRGLG